MLTVNEALKITPAEIEDLEVKIDGEIKRAAYNNKWPMWFDAGNEPWIDTALRAG